MAGFAPAIHVFSKKKPFVDARLRPGMTGRLAALLRPSALFALRPLGTELGEAVQPRL
jgi:hypothetical protein